MRTIWHGNLQLGRVSIPVGLGTVIRNGDLQVRSLHEECMTPVTRDSSCAFHERVVEVDEVVRAFEIAKGEYVVLDEQELAAAGLTESRTIRVGGFVEVGEVDPLLVQGRWYLAPSGQVGRRPYALLAHAIAELEVAALVRFVAWKTEQLGAVRALHVAGVPVLLLERLAFAEDLVAYDDTDGLDEVAGDTYELMRELVERHTRRLRPEDVVSEHRPRIRALLEAKLAGGPVVRAADSAAVEQPQPTPERDLADALKRSLREAPRRRRQPARTR